MKKKIYTDLDSIWETIETGKHGQQSALTDDDQKARERQQDAEKMQKMWQA
jgi:hypothetical protein